MAERQEDVDKSPAVERSHSNIFEQFTLPTGTEGQLREIHSAIKCLSDSLSVIRDEVNVLKRPVSTGGDTDKQTPKRHCMADKPHSDSEESVDRFFGDEEASDGEEDEFSLMDFFEHEEETGEPISDQLAGLANKALRAKPKQDKIKEILKKYKRPSNVENLQIPAINEQLWGQLQSHVKTQDFQLQKSQKHCAAALVPITRAMDMLKKEGSPQLKELIGDTFKILSNAVISTSEVRREKIRKELLPKYRRVCKSDASATHLFGDGLDDDIKKIKETRQQLTMKPFLEKRPGTSAQFYQNKPQTFPTNNQSFGQRRKGQQSYWPKKKGGYQNKFQRK